MSIIISIKSTIYRNTKLGNSNKIRTRKNFEDPSFIYLPSTNNQIYRALSLLRVNINEDN